MPKKRSFAEIGASALSSNKKRPASLQEFLTEDAKPTEAPINVLTPNEVVATEISDEEKNTVQQKKTPKRKKNEKLIRDSLAIPESDYSLFNKIKSRCMVNQQDSSKMDIIRAALRYLDQTTDNNLIKRIKEVRKEKRTHT